jgi:hypothetical protein
MLAPYERITQNKEDQETLGSNVVHSIVARLAAGDRVRAMLGV